METFEGSRKCWHICSLKRLVTLEHIDQKVTFKQGTQEPEGVNHRSWSFQSWGTTVIQMKASLPYLRNEHNVAKTNDQSEERSKIWE